MGHQKGFIGYAYAEFSYCTFGPLFIRQKKRVSLVTDPALQITVGTTTSF
jgi:hypothetical protein